MIGRDPSLEDTEPAALVAAGDHVEQTAPSGMRDLGVTVGELRAALDKLPANMAVVVRSADGFVGAIWNAAVDTGCAEDDDGNAIEFFAIEVSDDPDFVPPEDEGRHP